jgi:hypothetical protein
MELQSLNALLTLTVSELFAKPTVLELKPSPIKSAQAFMLVRAPELLRESLRTLGITLAETHGRNLEAMTPDKLELEKALVRQELANFTQCFFDAVGRSPEREEKEPMRPLYLYNKKIRLRLQKLTEADTLGMTLRLKGANKDHSLGRRSIKGKRPEELKSRTMRYATA